MNTVVKTSKKGFFSGTDIPMAVEPKDSYGKLHGMVIWNYENGVPKRKTLYHHGIVVDDKWFYTDGVEKKFEDNNNQCVSGISSGMNHFTFS